MSVESVSIKDPKIKILYVEPDSSRRSLGANLLRSLGFSEVQSMGSVKDVFASLGTDGVAPDWIITPLSEGESVNAMHLLDVLVRVPEFNRCRLSLILETTDVWWLHNAFEMGLFSCHLRSANAQGVGDTVAEVRDLGETFDSDDCLISAEYLRRHLTKIKRFNDLLQLEKSLLALRPNNQILPVKLAEAFYLTGKNDAALAVLSRTANLTGEAADAAAVLRNRMAATVGKAEDVSRAIKAMTAFAEEWGLERALVVDPDESVCTFLGTVLAKVGIKHVYSFSRGDAAWDYIAKNGAPDVIIQEWKLLGLSGSAFLQRIRSQGFHKVPVFIHSALVNANDRLLLVELGASDVIPKPLGQQQLAQALMAAIKAEKRPEEVTALERNARKALSAGDAAAAKLYVAKLSELATSPQGMIPSLEAELAFLAGDLKRAGKLAIEALQTMGENIVILNLLGKIYMKMRLFDQATKFLERADKLSPGNMQRLCALAEVHAESAKPEAASIRLEQAKKLDATNQVVIETEVKVVLAGSEQPNVVKGLLDNVSDPSHVIAFLNNRGVALAAEEKFDEAVALYDKALKSLPKQLDELRPTLTYNIALALIRKGDTEGARWHLAEASRAKGSPVMLKAKSLLERATKAVAQGVPLALNRPSSDPLADDAVAINEELLETGRGIPVAVGATPGDMRCHLVFQAEGPVDSRFLALLGNAPNLVRRVLDYGKQRRGSARKP